ncbi:proton-conducting transporter transmembrane domain-containing protein [Sphingomonas sp.]|uniref:proton-conducting transporter transmembrane domain-containing protein n=1 Tax=Sphingomonas sp. TaxID=28214 RepID=UPI002FD92130
MWWLANAGPAFLAAAALLAGAGRQFRPGWTLRVISLAALGALVAAVALAGWTGWMGPRTLALPGVDALVSTRLDVVSVTMLVLVSFVGCIVVRFAATYLDGEARQGSFMAWLAVTLASVMLLVSAGTLPQLVFAWIAAGQGLRRLLLFYPERAAARRAARKKAISTGFADVALIGSAVLLWQATGTTDIARLLEAARAGTAPGAMALAAWGIALAAMLKSAQFPLHGWLTEVMEAPTPVSALLHAGVINAGGFLLIRLADVMLVSPSALALLAVLGGFTALFGSLVLPTQPAIKTQLAWSTVAQMGFMVMQCGLGLFYLALLHIVAHSLYKAHAFLSSGGAVERIAAARRLGPVAKPDGAAVGLAMLGAAILYGALAIGFGAWAKPPQAVALGAILVFGVAYLIVQGMSPAAPRALLQSTLGFAILATSAYFILHHAAEWLTIGTLPPVPAPGPFQWVLLAVALIAFGGIALAQAMLPLWCDHPAAQRLRTHLSHGFYVNALLDRVIGSRVIGKA